MPPWKIHQSTKNAREALAEKRSFMATEVNVNDLKEQLYQATQKTQELERLLSEKEAQYGILQIELERSKDLINELKEEMLLWKAKHKEVYHSLRMQCQAVKCGLSKQGLLEVQIDVLKKADAKLSTQLLHESQDSKRAIDSLLKVVMHNPYMCDECITCASPCDTLTNLRHGDYTSQHTCSTYVRL